jgi:hypothetical protein
MLQTNSMPVLDAQENTVSEKGFDKHDDDVMIHDDIIMQELLRDFM